MKGSFQIAKIFGIPVQIHWTFSLVFLYLAYFGYMRSWDTFTLLWALFVFALFICVVLHEFGHALTARKFGVNTRDIILSPIGGVARLNRLPEKPIQEFLIALAGPAVNFAIAIILIPILLLLDQGGSSWSSFQGLFDSDSNFYIGLFSPLEIFIPGLIAMNIALAIFNLLPAFPMDGGRVLRALLSIRLGRSKATRVATYIGQTIAVLLFLYGMYNSSYITSFIGIFVFVTAAAENRMVKFDHLLAQHKVGDIVRSHFTPFYKEDTMEKAFAELKIGLEKNFLVFDQWQNLQGVLTERKIVEALKKGDDQAMVSEYIEEDYEYLVPSDSLKDVLHKMQWKSYMILPVFSNDRLSGVIDATMMNNFIRLQQKLK